MSYANSLVYQQWALVGGCILAGLFCLAGAVRQMQTGETWGATGKGKVFRSEEPGYFIYMFCMRLLIGGISLAAGLFFWGKI